ncbi:M13 family metallopeptidase [Carnimonas nigrificans]|uniref:M13 family metallopeptidase n=1 Tax=Carnimonas nigrificans TaxID=64323 RepID=UPI000470B4E7|nr:M13-type metalloendopeptidase [Carnimonas nigrificans]
MSAFFIKRTALGAAIALTMAGCQSHSGSNGMADQPISQSSVDYHIDQQKLPALIQFSPDDLDERLSACTDLNAYVNQKWIDKAEIPSDRPRWGAFDSLAERSLGIQRQIAEQAGAADNAAGVDKLLHDFWRSGMNEAHINQLGITPIKGELAAIDGLSSSAEVVQLLEDRLQEGDGLLFDMGASSDFKNPKRNILYIDTGGLGLPDKNYYTDARHADDLNAYQAYLARLLRLSGTEARQAALQAEQVVALEKRLARVSYSQEQQSRDASLAYNPISVSAADTLTPHIKWTTLLQRLNVDTQDKVSLVNPEFFKALDHELASTPVEVWKAYLKAHTLNDASSYLSDDFANARFDFYGKVLSGQKQITPRWKRVLSQINDSVGQAMGQRYVEVAFPGDAKARIQTLVGNLSEALKARIEAADWMSDETKARAIEKWKAFTPRVGYPDKWRDWSGLTTSDGDYLANIRAAQRFNFKWDLAKVGQPVDPNDWGMTPQTVNAYYNPLANEVVFPAAILQPPFFDPNADIAFNYGGIGAVIGHEMTHGFDDQGARFGPHGNFENWWTPADKKHFDALAQGLVEQFDHYKVNGQPVNGHLTLGENIADLGGLNTAYDALQKAKAGQPDPMVGGHSRDENFFFNFATVWRFKALPQYQRMLLTVDPHAPTSLRAIGAPSNMQGFADTFQCKPGDQMVRSGKQRVQIW